MAGFSFGTPTTSAPSFSFGSNTATGGSTGFNFAPTPATTAVAPTALQFNAPASTAGGVSFGAPVATVASGYTFGSGGLSMGTPATTQAPLAFKPSGLGGGLNFGSPATTQQPTLGFGTPALSTAQTGLAPGITPATTQQTLSFGSTTPGMTFGSTPGLSFGSTPATSQPLTFGSAPPMSQPTLNFGSAPPTTTQPTLSFGGAPPTTQSGLTFGTTIPTTQTNLSFGLTAPATTASTGFSLGTPASTAAGLSFGLGASAQATTAKPTLTFSTNATTAAATSTPSLLNFSAAKTTATPGFSLAVSAGTGTGTSSLFAVPTTSVATTTPAAVTFKGLGGVDPSTTQGSGQKDVKSVKENIVNPEIMQTLDTFKNFVKQQKNLGCEVSRAPVKPMHKVTEDTDALRQMLTSVTSALQKNKVIANKLKADTTKCLSLCEMAQRTHDTPIGLQNDNIAPLEFFIQLVSKFERDIQVLRQEIDNTEKHVNSLSYPAILMPQELSVALRRLHDSFVALAGRLQSAHAGVIAQKERHLSLRRHFLKDHTNIFEGSAARTAASATKPVCNNILPIPGPTPFSSISGLNNISLMAGQDKPVTFSSGPASISGWGSSTISGINPTSNFLQSPGSSVLSSPQPVDNQSFQLGKPPPGNKRGKR